MRKSTMVLIVLLLTVTAALVQARAGSAATAEVRVNEAYGKLPLSFEANRGQSDPRVRFLARSPGYTLFLTPAEAVLVLTRPERQGPGEGPRLSGEGPKLRGRPDGREVTRAALRITFAGASPRLLVEGREEPGKANYFRGNDPAKWRTQVPTYARVHYRDLYPGIDLVWYGNQRELEYDLVVAPTADPGQIVLGIEGADRLEIDAGGDLVLHTAAGAVRQRKPLVYQEADGVRRTIAGGYVLKDAHQVAFQVGAYDAGRPLVIDPVLVYSTYLGGSNTHDSGLGIAVDGFGNAYVTGYVFWGHTSADFPTTAGAYQTAFGGGTDAFVAKLDPTGSSLVYSTYLGGSEWDSGRGIAVDDSGNAYVTGYTSSTDFPTVNAVQPAFGGGGDAFVVKLDATGSRLEYATYLGGRGADVGTGIAVDASGNAYIVGSTASPDFPTANAVQPASGGFDDAFVVKLDATGSAFAYATYLGGRDGDAGTGIAVDGSGSAYVTGWTQSNDFPTANPLKAGNGSARVFKSATGGERWAGLGLNNLSVSALVLDPVRPLVVYAGTAGAPVAAGIEEGAYYGTFTDGDGVFKSTDGGASWTAVNAGLSVLDVLTMAIDPRTPSTLYVGTRGGGVFKSIDGGENWGARPGTHPVVRSLAIDPVNPSIIYAGASWGGLFKSFDGGASWTRLELAPPAIALAIDTVMPSTLYAGVDARTGGVSKSIDGGMTWTPMNIGLASPNPAFQSWPVFALLIDPANPLTLYAGTYVGVFKSIDGGAIWTRVLSGAGVTALAVAPTTNGLLPTVYAGTFGGGVFRSTDGGVSWNMGLANETVPSLAVDPTAPSVVYAGTRGHRTDAFLAKLDPAGSAMAYSTYLGGWHDDRGFGIAVDSSGHALVTGFTRSHDFPVANAVQPTLTAHDSVGLPMADAFLTKVDPSGSSLVYSTALGGSRSDGGAAVATDASGHAYVTGITQSFDFPTANPFQPTLGALGECCFTTDAFVLKMADTGP